MNLFHILLYQIILVSLILIISSSSLTNPNIIYLITNTESNTCNHILHDHTCIHIIHGGKIKNTKKKKLKSKQSMKKNRNNINDMEDMDKDKNEDFIPKKATALSYSLDRLQDVQHLAFKVGKASIKSLVSFVGNKHVNKLQVVGKWKILQDINIRPGVIINFPATIEFFEDDTLKTQFEGKEYISKFSFVEKSWPAKCSITFEAKACVLGGDIEPVSLLYKGYFKRSLMKPNVILIRGKIYKTSGSML